jgi:hypothetical protein
VKEMERKLLKALLRRKEISFEQMGNKESLSALAKEIEVEEEDLKQHIYNLYVEMLGEALL